MQEDSYTFNRIRLHLISQRNYSGSAGLPRVISNAQDEVKGYRTKQTR
jgi:hypothetical protein